MVFLSLASGLLPCLPLFPQFMTSQLTVCVIRESKLFLNFI